MKEVPQVIPKYLNKSSNYETYQVKFIDKVSFFLGVACIIFTEFLALRHPEYFTQYYFGLITLLLSYRSHNRVTASVITNICRYVEYSATKSQLFMVDFCYFMNLSVITQTSLFPDNLVWYKVDIMGNIVSIQQ